MSDSVDLEQLTTMHARYVALAARIEPLQQEMDEIKSKARSMAPLGTTQLANGAVTVSPNRRFNPEHAAAVLPAELVQQCSETVVSPKKAKRVLAPALYEACMIETGEPKVTFK